MTKFTVSMILIALFAALFVSVSLFLIPDTAEAGPTKIEIQYWKYTCIDFDGRVCVKPIWVKKTTKYQTRWHKWFGKHPHRVRKTVERLPDIRDEVPNCSECSF